MPTDRSESHVPDTFFPAEQRDALVAVMAHWWVTRDAGESLPATDRAVLEALIQDEVLATCPRAVVHTAEMAAWLGADGPQVPPDKVAAIVERVRQASSALWQRLSGLLGQVRYAQAAIMRLGRKRFGPPTARHEAAVAGITDLARLEVLSERLLDVATWDDLLADA